LKIAVCVKEVPDATAPKRIDPVTKRLDRSGERTINPYDLHALEEAVRLKEGAAGTDSLVTAVCMGPPDALRTLHKALSRGADEALLVSDPALEGADIATTARVLAAAAKHLGADLVLLGQQASDSDSYVMAAAVAEHLQRPLVTQVARLELAGDGVRAKRQSETGYDVVEAPLPAVISVSDAINEPRIAKLKEIMAARKKPQTTLALADLGVEAATGTEVLELTPPAAKEGGRRIEDENGSSAEEIVAFLLERKAI
jgi:electron transfer flavoprotein beta subunit